MAKKSVRQTQGKPAAKKNQKSTSAAQAAPNVRVKKGSEVLVTLQNFVAYNLHGRYNLSLSKGTQKRLVAYGPWLAALLVVVIIPELLALAKTGSLITFTGFFDTIFFNQESWVILSILFVNTLLLVDGITHLFEKTTRGWTRIYQASLIATAYIIWQLLNNFDQPAAPILALIGSFFILFTLFDIRKYYQ